MTTIAPPRMPKVPGCSWCQNSVTACLGHRNGWPDGPANDPAWPRSRQGGYQQCCGRRPDKDRCRLPAAPGQLVCKRMHGGATKKALNAAARKKASASAKTAVATYGLPVETTPEQALLGELYRTVGHVQWLGTKVAGLPETGLKQLDDSGKFERPSVWVELYQGERQHLARVAKDCIAAGIEERKVRQIEALATDLVALIRRVVDRLELTPAQRDRAHLVVAEELRQLA